MDKKTTQKRDTVKGNRPAVIEQEPIETIEAETPKIENGQSQSALEKSQERVEDAKFFMGPEQWPVTPAPRELAAAYNDNRIVLMVVDPWWAHSYWEVTQDRIQEGLRTLGCSYEATRSILRVYDVTGREGSDDHNSSFDIELRGLANSWYLHLNTPDHSYRVDIGLMSPDGRFFTLARSNTVTLPRASMSEVIDERWMSQEFDKIYSLSGGFRLGAGSIELKEQMEKRFQEALFSGALISSIGISPVKKKERSFWFVLDTELIVYGATEPDAQVTVCGRPVQLRPDGTFTLRFALPDGKFPIPATARSADGVEERTITPVVQRNTEVSQPVIKS